MIVLQGGLVNPTPNHQLFWRPNVFCQGCLPYLVGPNLKASGTRFSPLRDLAVKTLPRSHDVDVHASDLVGIDCITRVLIVHIPQQDVCPRGHILPLWPPFPSLCRSTIFLSFIFNFFLYSFSCLFASPHTAMPQHINNNKEIKEFAMPDVTEVA
jgi:hypothetical protein